MKSRTLYLIFIAISLSLAISCGDTPKNGTSSSAPEGTNADAYAEMLDRSRNKLKESEKENAILSALSRFMRDNRRYPTNLTELVSARYLPSIPAPQPGFEYYYQPDRGIVRIRPVGTSGPLNEHPYYEEEEEEEAEPVMIEGLNTLHPETR